MPAVPGPLPAPEAASSWTEFTAKLRALHEWCGRPKYRALCGRSEGLSPAAVSTLIGKNPLTRPPETATVRFVEACLRYGEVYARGGGRQMDRAVAAARRARLPGAAGVVAWAVGRGRRGRRSSGGGDGRLVRRRGVGGSSGAGCQHVRGSIEDLRMKRTWPSLFQCRTGPGSACTRRRRSVPRSPCWRPTRAGSSAGRAARRIRAATTSGTTRRATGRRDGPNCTGGDTFPRPRFGREAPDPAVTRRC